MRRFKGPYFELSGGDGTICVHCPKCHFHARLSRLPILESDFRFECQNFDCDYEYPEQEVT